MPRLHAAVLVQLVLLGFSTSDSFAASRAAQPPPSLQVRGLDATRTPVPFATVSLRLEGDDRQNTTVLTNTKGEVSTQLSPGRYTVVIKSDGFSKASRRVAVGSTEPASLEVVLSIASFSQSVDVPGSTAGRQAVVSSATRTPTPLRDVPQAVSVVSRELIAEQRIASMAEVVRFMPGVTMAQGEGNRDTPVFRGNASTADFFVDGVRDDVQYFRDVYNVERVEALKGPNAMIFGRGGAGGVINRVTRQADWGRAREVSIQTGSWDNRRITADLGTALNSAVAARVTGMYEKSDSYRAGVGVERVGVQPSFAFRLGPVTTVRASYEYFHDERVADRGVSSFNGLPLATDSSTFFGDPSQSPMDSTVNVVAAVLDHQLPGGATLRNRLSYGVYDKFYQNVFPGAVNAAGTMVTISAYNNATDRTNLFNQTELVLRARTGGIGHTLLVGAELGRQETDNFRSTGFFNGTSTSVQAPISSPTIDAPVTFRQSATDANDHGVASLAAVYAQDQVELTSRLQAVAGVRFDAFDIDFTNNRAGAALSASDRMVSPRLGLVYKPILPLSLYGSYSLTFVPRAGEQLASLSVSNEALEPEEFRNYELGAKWDIRPALGVTAALYRLDRGNVAVPDPNDPTRSVLVDAQRSEGVELELTGALTPVWNLIAGYAWQEGTITRSISATAQTGASLAHVPAHSLSLWSKYDITPRWSAALGLVRRTAIFASTDSRVVLPGFTRVDGALFFDVTSKMRAQVNVENLFDEGYYASAHSNSNITPGSPRAVKLALTTRF